MSQESKNSTVTDAIERVNRLKTLVKSLLGEKNDELIEQKLLSIQTKIKELATLKTQMDEQTKLLSDSYKNAIDLMKTTDDISALYEPMGKLKNQIDATINFNEGELDGVITGLKGLVSDKKPEVITSGSTPGNTNVRDKVQEIEQRSTTPQPRSTEPSRAQRVQRANTPREFRRAKGPSGFSRGGFNKKAYRKTYKKNKHNKMRKIKQSRKSRKYRK